MMLKNHCEFCEGLVQERFFAKEVFRHKNGFVILENVPIGVCNNCGRRYFSAKVLREVDKVAKGKRKAQRTEAVPVAEFV